MNNRFQFPGFDQLPASTQYKFTRDGLLEKTGTGFVLYGDWCRLFGCWVKEGNARAQEVVPDWPVFAADGQLKDVEEITAIRKLAALREAQIPLGAKARLRFTQHFDRIPKILRHTVCQIAEHQWPMLDMASQVHGFSWFLVEERQFERLGFVSLCYSLATIEGPLSRAGRRHFAQEIMIRKRRDFLSQISGLECENRHVKFLEKLSFSASGVDIRRFLRAAENEQVSLVLSHAKRINEDLANAALYVPEGFFHPNVGVLLEIMSLERLCRNVAEIKNLLSEEQISGAASAFSRIRNEDEFWNWIDTWDRKAAQVSKFPPPPVSLPAPFVPITTYASLEQEGRDMHNCSATYWRQIVSGEVYFYHWRGEEEATVCIGVDNHENWELFEALGFANAELSEKTYEKVEELISDKTPGGTFEAFADLTCDLSGDDIEGIE